MKKALILLCIFSLFNVLHAQSTKDLKKDGLASINTPYTIYKVRIARNINMQYIVASSYEGTLLGVTFEGKILWENPLSGFMNHDIWTSDVNGDGNDEIFAANADGAVYCVGSGGQSQWEFKPNDAPMYAVCSVRKGGKTYVVAGGYDKSIYYLSPQGELIKKIRSEAYSQERPIKNNLASHGSPSEKSHIANFLRPLNRADGTEYLALHGINNSMAAVGSMYFFEPLADAPTEVMKVENGKGIGDMQIVDVDRDGHQDVILGTSTMIDRSNFTYFNLDKQSQTSYEMTVFKRNKGVGTFGYRVPQTNIVSDAGVSRFFTLYGSNIFLTDVDKSLKNAEVLEAKYAFNDMVKIPDQNKVVLASSQSGGSAIHIIDLDHQKWKVSYENISPPGKIATILENSEKLRKDLESYQKPSSQRDPVPVYLLDESVKGDIGPLVDKLVSKYESPVFLGGAGNSRAENWDRSGMENEKYKLKRDRRRKYDMTQGEALDMITENYQLGPGIAYWGGHGNDPFMYQVSTTKKVIDFANGKKTVLIYPELEDHSDDFDYVMDNLVYPLAEYAQDKNTILYLRNKHTFWLGSVYKPSWSRLVSGEFADVFVPSMEETTDKSMELSFSGRMGLWASGAVDSWGTRCARDNASFDRLRQHSHQMLPNHFLRNMVYHAASGAQYMHNFPVDQTYMSLLWELIAKEALFVPKRSEIVSFSPVYLSMTEPDDYYMDESTNVKWLTFYDEQSEKENPRVFSHLNGSWPGAPVTEWDFSKYAAGQKERRLNFLSTYNNGLVLITPPQAGVFAMENPERGAMIDHLHPIYKKIMKEYITDGRNYYSADGKQTYAANEYYTEIAKDIQESAGLLPITVTGDAAWVVAQTAPKNLRLTLIDNGYINPNQRRVTVNFNTISPVKLTNILTKEVIRIEGDQAEITIPLGMFCFIDVELGEEL